ncbi:MULTISPECIES: ATP-dependent zinc metalloprotease FtsH [Fusobacterium]|uniref:ATP-dependent zinc metalloprotease FtsH n=2 Tax=Fusobacteriaceae TaxID=203492 RepID=UPI0008A46DE3|nr:MULTISPECIES: ATP-dependent zinc metalloprotease FtsH [Fusobacterium]MDY4006529.1 ATP-dependent zinc metalloprotease FtsH [Fusobacterium varium]OFL85707.1 cell division protein FtsH [Fusobacterium sp. HMSC073F01]RGJ26657.1 ATP-dependent metallopeptidase FtsH/Yme1/Tma family protein [Fusobacterium varium]RHG33637.1 ATP-dependent metallopeptidase FtsH/Yme1/Tma family protein [Fusobacterium varium]
MNREDFIEEKVFYIEEEEVKDSEKKEKPQEDEKKTIQEPDNKKPQEDEEKKNEEKEKIHDEIKERKEELKSKLRDGLNQSSNKSEEDRNNKLKSLGGKFNFKGFVMLLFIVTLIASAPALLSTNAKTPSNEVGYSEFINHVKNKEIVKVNEKEGYVYGYSPEDEKKEVKSYKARMITDRLGDDPVLVKTIEENNASIKSLPPQELPFLLNMLASWFPMLLLIGVWIFMLNRMNKGSGGGPQIFNMGKSKAKDNGEEISKVTFDDVAGIAEAKVELEEVVKFLKEPETFKKIGARIPKGVLLLGGPGTGKTLLAKAVAGEAKVPFFSMSGSEFVEMFVGVGASRVRDLFNKARKSAPCIIFIDEIDAVGRKRGSGQGGGNDEREQTLNQLLVEMDGFGTDETIIVLAATNRPEILDKALMRPGRFDRQVIVDNPDIKGREEILKVHIRGKKIAKDVDLSIIAKKTPGFVGADLANLLNEAAILAAREGREEITMADLEEASEKVSIGPERKSKVMIEKERLITAYHEAGHALMHYLLPNTDPVHKITIVPRGMAGGFTMALPEEERSYKFKSEFFDDIRVLFGGRAAEQIVFNDITTGASNDIERATAIAHAIVTRFGMTSKFGPMLLDNTKEGDLFQQKYYSDTTGKEVDDEIRGIISTAYTETLDMIKKNYQYLDNVAKALLEKETLVREEFEAIMQGKTLADLAESKKEAAEIKADEAVEEKEKEDIAEKIKADDAVRVLDEFEEKEEEKFSKD